MIKHIVFWKLKDTALGKSKYENAVLIKNQLENLKNLIPEIQSIELWININKSDCAYDLVLYSTFKNKSDLEKYLNHSEHKKAWELVSKLRIKRVVVDYEAWTSS